MAKVKISAIPDSAGTADQGTFAYLSLEIKKINKSTRILDLKAD